MAKKRRKLKRKKKRIQIGTARLRGKSGEAKKIDVVAIREKLGKNFKSK
tara:strand:+ start:28181 stop:28327 length:147 start_codon:yes stop_codon:yes gene_type:complete